MDPQGDRTFNAKLLLFGEYTIIQGSDALALPLPLFGGRWAFLEAGRSRTPQQQLPAFCTYLESLEEEQAEWIPLDTGRFDRDLAKGLYFDSNIPTGYGLGSSGALCAAVFDRYVDPAGNLQDLLLLRRTLARMESFFHGSSSGTDPLICYLDRPVKVHAGGKIESVQLPPPSREASFFLLDTGLARETGPLVALFMEKCGQKDFQQALEKDLMPVTGQAIGEFLAGDWTALAGSFRRISAFQLQRFPEMIPPAFRPVWKQGLETEAYHLKLCGAGGGGFLLGFTFQWEEVRRSLQGFSLLRIPLAAG